MSSNIKIPKFCTYCGTAFIAKTTTTRFCGHTCGSRAHKQRVRESKIKAALTEQITTVSNSGNKSIDALLSLPIQSTNFINLRDKEFLSVQEAAVLLGTSRWTIQRMIKDNRLPASKLGSRTIIKRTSIDNLFN